MVPVSELFEIRYGHSLELNRQRFLSLQAGGIPFVSRKMGDNGISAYIELVDGMPPERAGVLTVALGGNGVMSTFLQEAPFYSGRDMAHLRPTVEMSKQQLLFYCTCLLQNRYRFSYGRQANRTLKTICVPALSDLPAYVEDSDVHRFNGCDAPQSLTPPSFFRMSTWKPFVLGSLFNIQKGQRLTKANMKSGTLPFVGASDTSNGVTATIGAKPLHKAETISVSYNGSVAEAFFQPEPFWATDDVNVLYPKGFKLTAGSALFICTVIRMEKYRYNYGRKWHLDRMRESVIKLPATPDGKPDLAYMEQYIRSLPYSSQIE